MVLDFYKKVGKRVASPSQTLGDRKNGAGSPLERSSKKPPVVEFGESDIE